VAGEKGQASSGIVFFAAALKDPDSQRAVTADILIKKTQI
jgi:hypothetical protein